MGEWKTVKLGDIEKDSTIELGRGEVISKNDIHSKPGIYPIYSSSSKNDGLFGQYGKYIFDEELITWSVDGGGYFFHRPKHKFSITNVSGYLRLIDKDKYDYKFLFYNLHFQHLKKHFDYQYKSHPSTLREAYDLPLIGIKEQQKIAQILTKADEAIQQTERLIAKYEAIRTGLMQDLLTCGIDEAGNIRSEETHAFKDSELGRIPVEWEVENIGKILDSINQGWSPDCESKPAQVGEWGVLKTSSVQWNRFVEIENKLLPHGIIPRSKYEVNKGDVLLTRAGPNSRVGVVAVVNTNRKKLLLSDKIYRLKPTNRILGEYLSLVIASDSTQRDLDRYKSGLAESQTNISQSIVQKLLVKLPCVLEQQLIIDKIRQSRQSILEEEKNLGKLQNLKTALMQDLLTGNKRVDNLLT